VMGPDEHGVALALAGMIPHKGTLVTGEHRHLATLARCAADRESTVVSLAQSEVAAVSETELDGFAYVEHAENVALAVKVCELLGVDRRTAVAGMQKASPDPGVMTTHEIDFFGRRIVFVNGFAANDPESTRRVWEMALARFPDVEKRVALVNCRADRPGRSKNAAACRWHPRQEWCR